MNYKNIEKSWIIKNGKNVTMRVLIMIKIYQNKIKKIKCI